MSIEQLEESMVEFAFSFEADDIGLAAFGSDMIRSFLQSNPRAIGYLACCFLRTFCDLTGDSMEEREYIASEALAEFQEMIDSYTDSVTTSK